VSRPARSTSLPLSGPATATTSPGWNPSWNAANTVCEARN